MFTRCIGVRYSGVISTINRLMNFLVRLTKSILISLLLRRSRVLFFSFRLFCTVLNEIPISNYLFRYRKEFNIVANFLRSFRYLKLTLLYTLKRGFFFLSKFREQLVIFKNARKFMFVYSLKLLLNKVLIYMYISPNISAVGTSGIKRVYIYDLQYR